MKKGFNERDICELIEYQSLLNVEALELLERFNGVEIEETYNLSMSIPLINKNRRCENECC